MINYAVLSKQSLTDLPFQKSSKPIVPVEPDLLLEMTFSPKLFIISGIASEVEKLVVHGVEWLDARADCSPSQPSDDEIRVYEDYRMPYIHRGYRLTDKEKQYGKLNWLDIESTEFDFSKLESISLEDRLIFKLEEDFGLVFIHKSVIELFKKGVKDVLVRDV